MFAVFSQTMWFFADYGNVIFANCSTSDRSLLENIYTKATKIILGCFRTSRNAAVLSDLRLIPLSNRRELHMLLFFYKIKTGLTSPVLHSFLPLTRGKISAYSLHHANNFQFPLSKRSLVHNSFFYKAPVLRNSLPQYIKLSSSFAAFKNRIALFYHGKNRNIWHLQAGPAFSRLDRLLPIGPRAKGGLALRLRTYTFNRKCLCSAGAGPTVFVKYEVRWKPSKTKMNCAVS